VSADELVARLGDFADGEAAWAAAMPWLADRPGEAAAREILAAAAEEARV
jgi:hypothetical protein